MDLVSHTLQVKIMARSCLGEIFKLEASLTLKLDSAAGAEAGGVAVLESSRSCRGSLVALLVASMIVWRDLNPAVAGEGNTNPARTMVSNWQLTHLRCRSANN